MAAILNLSINKGDTFERFFAFRGVTIADLADTTNASPILSGLIRTDVLTAGMTVTGTGIPLGTTILSIIDTHSLTLSANATADGTDVAITFVNPNYLDLTPYSFRGQIRQELTSPDIGCSFGFVKNVDNTVKMTLTASASASLIGVPQVYDVEMYTAADAYVVKILKGTVTANEEVTR